MHLSQRNAEYHTLARGNVHDSQVSETDDRSGIAVVMEAPASVSAVGRYQQFDGAAVGGDSDEGYHPAFHDRNHRIVCPCPCPCLYPGLEQVPNQVVNPTVTVAASSDLELALNRAEFPNEPACVGKAMGTEREVAERRGSGNDDHDRSSAVGIGH